MLQYPTLHKEGIVICPDGGRQQRRHGRVGFWNTDTLLLNLGKQIPNHRRNNKDINLQN